MTIAEIEARQAEISMWAGVVLLAILSVCAAVTLLILIHHAWKQEQHRHAEAMQRAISTKDIGQTAWANTDVNKSRKLREQAKRIRELEQWKAHTEKRLASLNLSDYAKEVNRA